MRRTSGQFGIIPSVIVALLILSMWQMAASADDSGLAPSPLGILMAAPSTLADPGFWFATGDTALAVLQGLVIGCVLGTAIGIVSGRFGWIRSLIAPYVSGLYAVPLLALVPVVTIWLGYSSDARLAVVITAAMLPSIVSTADGVRTVAPELEDAMSVLGVGRGRRLIDLVIPAALPFILAGLNVAIGRAIVGAVAVEFLASVPGLGSFILAAARSFNQNIAFVGVITLVLLGVLAHAAVDHGRKRWAPWQVR